jgi:hypothetical protein
MVSQLQGFGQSFWDDLHRSNRSLKLTRSQSQSQSQSQIAWAPQIKKAETSSVSATAKELPQIVNERPLPQLPPKSFEEATQMVAKAWKVAFPSLRFPVKLIGLFPAAKSTTTIYTPTNHQFK